ACTPAPEPPPGVDPVLLPADVRDRLEARLDRELAQGWQPHTPNVWAATGRPMYTNRLIEATSPYLRQHAHDQVSWMAWGPEALELAARTGRPIFLSIGYATCHWCHVMQEESFRDADIAALINSRFVPIKVDRETRPDLDQLYMDAVLAMNGSGGWPATLVLDPAGRPFFATTYVPPHDGDRGRAKGLQTLLQ
ncbi:MAG: thioredoxin domain-containing protein, partial [Bdellovibrionales bacterium]|nr:thioredoxin domain-containing protein [Bdellovibrionales bacterium]